MLVDTRGDVRRLLDNTGRALGLSAEGLLGQGWMAAVHVQDRVAVLKALGDCAAGRRNTAAEFRLSSRPDGVSRSGGERYLLTCSPVEGERSTVTADIRDITFHRQHPAVDWPGETTDESGIARDRFLAQMSHELRTPLNAILGFSELLMSPAMGALPAGRQEEYVGLIHTSARHLLNVVNDILDMSKMQAGKYEIFPEAFDLKAALLECHAMMRVHAEAKRIRYRLEIGDALPELVADSRAVRQIVLNLLSNALKFTGDGGEVALAARRHDRSVEITVADTGIGISQEHLANLGRPFYQADSKYDRKYEGTGLGLSLVRGLVGLHGGRLSFASKRDRGTTVTVELPVNRKPSRPVPADEPVEYVRRHEPVARTVSEPRLRQGR
jgi:cell cycle sensor histidine kinase DivJ